jgi:hypothetical protein
MEFMHRFLQHVLPSGFMKVRYYGFLHPGCSISLDEIADMIREACGLTIADADDAEAPSSAPTNLSVRGQDTCGLRKKRS